MINIAVCDDERAEIEYLSALVSKWAQAQKVEIRLFEYESAESFLFDYEEKEIDLLLLDIQMKKMDGVNLARKIRGSDDAMQIIFITGYPDFIGEGYDVSALHYLLKPVKEGKLFEVLDRAITRLQKPPRIITFPKTGGSIKIKTDDIIYAEVLSHTVYLYLADGGREEFHMRISDMENLLGGDFFKCHRSFIVSMKYVRRVTKKAILLDNGKEIPLSRNLYDAANQAFIGFN